MNKKFESLGMRPANILLPKAGTDMHKWAVVACDQFTSQPEYWEEVDRIAGDAPSTLRLILPESKLNDANVDEPASLGNCGSSQLSQHPSVPVAPPRSHR